MHLVVVGHYRPGYALAYYFDWRDAFLGSGHQVRVINTWRPWRRPPVLFETLPARCSLPVSELRAVYSGELPCDVLVFAPSFYYANGGSRRRFFLELAAAHPNRFTTVYFMENEYRLLLEKVELASELGASVLVSQFEPEVAERLYRPGFRGRVLSGPAALNPDVFCPSVPLENRTIDVGTRSHRYPSSLGDDERNRVLDRFTRADGALAGLRLDVSSDQGARLSRPEWAAFLNRCRATVSTEAGAVQLSLGLPGAATVSGKVVSSRHFEAMGTLTGQVLTPGRFNGMLTAGEHYIPLASDFSNLQEVGDAVRDLSYLRALTERAREHALSGHTYAHRVAGLLAAL